MTVCAGCGVVLTEQADGWCDPDGRPFCGPGKKNWHLPALSAEDTAADAADLVADLRSTATARGRFYGGTR